MTRIRLPNSTLSADPAKQMKRGGPIARKTKLAKSNRKRQAKRKAEGLVYGPYHRWISRQVCIVTDRLAINGSWHTCKGEVTGHHLKTVASGGEDYGNEVPVCVVAHDAIHWSADRFEYRYDINLHESAARYARLWEEREGEE